MQDRIQVVGQKDRNRASFGNIIRTTYSHSNRAELVAMVCRMSRFCVWAINYASAINWWRHNVSGLSICPSVHDSHNILRAGACIFVGSIWNYHCWNRSKQGQGHGHSHSFLPVCHTEKVITRPCSGI